MIKFSLQWHITQKCQNRCKHCYMDDQAHDLTYAEYLECINNICNFDKNNDFNISMVALTGGDPLLNEDWYKIASDLKKRKKKIMILGNPEKLSDENLKKISELSIMRYQLSIDGMMEKHDYIRSEGSFNRTIEAIKKLNAYNIPIGIMFTVSDYNASDLFEVIRYLDSLKIELLFAFDFVISTGNAKQNHLKFTMKKDKLYKEYFSIREYLIRKNSLVKLSEKPTTMWVYKNFERFNQSILQYVPYTTCDGCGAGWKHLTIVNKGDVLACRRMPVKVGNLFENSFEDILLTSPFLKKLRDFENIGKCTTCIFQKFCRGCPADTYAKYGVPFIDNNACEWYIEYNNKSIKYKTEIDKLYNSFYQFKSYNKNKDYIKALFYLDSSKEVLSFLSNVKEWGKKHKINLNSDEIFSLLYLILQKN
ncbi:MAG: radical SAM protein [Bacilli bacterium]|nr:radical SAM protein [Bacilli bacterium]